MNCKDCKDCKYWKTKGQISLDEKQIGRCKRVKMFWDCTTWASDGESQTLTEEAKNNNAFIQDGSNYYAELLTFPEFGCNQFEAL